MPKFCISLPDEPQPVSSYFFVDTPEPMALVMESAENPKIFDSIENALKFVQDAKIKRNGKGIEVREYLGRSKYVYEIACFGKYKIGKDIFYKI